MQLHELTCVLGKHGLQSPDLVVLRPTLDDYDLILYQPIGRVVASANKVQNRNLADAKLQCLALCRHGLDSRVHMLVTPEYSFPWDALSECLTQGVLPPEGALWVLGCESITKDGLLEFAGRHVDVSMIHEDLASLDWAGKTFLDPVVYLFRTTTLDGRAKVAAVVQFKTHPSIDNERIEGDNLCCGKAVYVFGTEARTIRLVTFICSDVFVVDDKCLDEIFDRTLILHLQLNPNPRETRYLDYRRRLMSVETDATEIICLNWARSVKEWVEGTAGPARRKPWKNIGGSAWYLRPEKLDSSDERVADNHRKGLYYTRLHPKWSVLFFNYGRLAFHARTSKVWHRNVAAVQSKRTGPRIVETLTWNWGSEAWRKALPSDGFVRFISDWKEPARPLATLHTINPISIERLLALTAGAISTPARWFHVDQLNSFRVKSDEVIQRVSYAQDPDTESIAARQQLVRTFVGLQGVLPAIPSWPPALRDLAGGLTFTWTPNKPHHNVTSADGRPATIVYLADDPAERDLISLGDKIRTSLGGSRDIDRCCIVYRRNGHTMIWTHPNSTRFDMPQSTSPTSITEV